MPILAFTLPVTQVRNWRIQGLSVVLACYAVLYNHPSIVIWLHDCPIYFRDLENTTLLHTDPNRFKFQTIWLAIQRFTVSLAISVVCIYYKDLLKHTSLNWLEILGFFGGFISLLYRIVDPVGNILLYVLNQARIRSCQCSPNISQLHEPSISDFQL